MGVIRAATDVGAGVSSNLTSVRLQSFRNDCNQAKAWLLEARTDGTAALIAVQA